MINNLERGVSLIITFFIMTIILSVVMAISTILYSEIKIIRNIGNSVVSFFAADGGVEKVLYYDRKEVPIGGERGMCNICNACPDCQQCSLVSGLDCQPETCSDCHIVLLRNFINDTGESYNLDIVVNQQCKISSGTINSYGFYKDASRAIRLDSKTKVSSLYMPPGGAYATAETHANGVNMSISVNVLDPEGVGIESVVAAISGSGQENSNQCDPTPPEPFTECTYREVALASPSGNCNAGEICQANWNFGIVGVTYHINIMATDNNGNCVEVKDIIITYD